jgi:hypothetical protein
MKHWQLFVLLVGVPLLFDLFVMASIILTRNFFGVAFYSFPVIMILFASMFFGWFYSLGTNLFRILPGTQKMNLTTFKIFFFIPLVYISALTVFICWSVGNTPNPMGPWVFLVIFPLHIFCMFCIFYCLWFIAKSLKAAELQRPVTAGDYIGEFFLIWFYPVGVWFIQPRINKLFDPSSSN